MIYKQLTNRLTKLPILLLAGWAAAWPAHAQTTFEAVPDPNTELVGTWNEDGTVMQPLESWTPSGTGIMFAFNNGGGRTSPAYYNNGQAIRLYKDNTLEISSEDDNILTSVAFYNSYDKATESSFTVSSGKLSYDSSARIYTWENYEGVTNPVFTVVSGQVRITKAVITMQGSGEITGKPKAPVLSQGSCTFYEPFQLTITDLNEPAATVKYTLDGSDPSADNGLTYTAPITIPIGKIVTVKAVAINENGTSSIVSATYTYITKYKLSFKIPNKNSISYISFSSNSDYGSFEGEGSIFVDPGDRVDAWFNLNDGYKLTSVTLNGSPLEADYQNIHFTMPGADTEVIFNTVYDPTSPADPTAPDQQKKYTLTAVSNPAGAGSLSGTGEYESGASLYLYANGNHGYLFTGWSKDGKTISTENTLYYTMPAEDVVLTANYVYNPVSPGDPQQPVTKHPLTAVASPAGAATFSYSGSEIACGETYYVEAYPHNGYSLKGWIVNGVAQENNTTLLRGVMTEAGAQVVALFTYNPSAPSNPGANFYNPETGLVIVDDFASGSLYNTIYDLTGGNIENISSLVVKGQMSSRDYNNLSRLSNVGVIDLSRTGGYNTVPSYTFEGSTASDIELGAAVTAIDSYAFRNCGNLASLTVHATVPPTCYEYTFADFTNKDNCVVYVPKESIELYNEAPYWKEFSILPISKDAHVLQVNLPADATDGRYKHNSIEIINLNSGVRQKYVVSDRLLYTFNGMRKGEQYNIYMYSQAGLEIGRIENVVIPDGDWEVTFADLKTLHTVKALVLASDGSDVTSEVSVEWAKPLADGSETYLRKAVSLGEIPEGQQLICRVTLNDKLGMAYVNPEDVRFTVGDGSNICTVKLIPFRTIELTGSVADAEGAVIPDVTVTANQTLNGKYSKTYTVKADRKGAWTLPVLDAPETRLTYSAAECVTKNDTVGAFNAGVSKFDLGKTTLRSIVGARITCAFTYHAAGAEESQDNFADYRNVAINVFNVTQQRAHNEVSLQYPLLAVLDENIKAGDVLKLTATSRTGTFAPVEESVTVDENQRAEATFDIIGKGGISAQFEMTENPAVTAMLYEADGDLLTQIPYTEAKALFTELEDGEYTLVSMGKSDLMNSILRLSNFSEIGLTEGKDYVKNSVTVETGKLSEVKIKQVPAFDESLFYYTNDETGFSANKSSITTGNYLTLRSVIDFKGIYKKDISNVALVVDLPKNCDFVAKSVIQGPNQLPYTIDNSRLTVQLGDSYENPTRFCVIPTAGGAFNATASISFDYNGKRVTQPIGSAISQIKDLDFSVPASINSETFLANGMAPAGSQIDIYEEGTVIGSGRVLANGTWKVECTIPESYNFATHTLYAVITTKDGIKLQTESVTTELDRSSSIPKTVLMTFYNGWLHKNVNVTFDFENLTIDNPGYMFYTETSLSFVADFTDNNPEHLTDVSLWTLSSDNTETEIPLSYDETSKKWVGSHTFSYYTAPVNLTIEYTYNGQKLYDRKQLSDFEETRESVLTDNIAEREEFIREFDAEVPEDATSKRLAELFAQEDPDEDEIRSLLGMTDEPEGVTRNVLSDEEFDALCKQADASWEEWQTNGAPAIREQILTDYYADPDYDLLSDFNISTEIEGGTKTVSKQQLTTVNRDELVAQGYTAVSLDDGSELYVLYSENLIEVVDCGKMIKYTSIIDKSAAAAGKQNLPSKVVGSYLNYANAAKNALAAIYYLSTTDRRRWLVDVAAHIHEATEGISNFYHMFMNDFNEKVKYTYEKLQILCDQEIEDQEALIDAAEERIKEYTDKINENKRQRDVLKHNRDVVKNSTTLSDAEKERILKEYDADIKELTEENKHLNGKRAGDNTRISRAKTKIEDVKVKSSKFRKVHTKIRETIDKFPKRLAKGLKIPKCLRICGKVAGELGLPLQCWSLFTDMVDMADDITEWIPVMDRIDAHHCYKKGDEKAVSLHESIYNSADSHATQNVGILSSQIAAIGFSLAGGVPGSPTWWAELGISITAEIWKHFNDKASERDRSNFSQQISSLKCKDDDDDKDKDKDKDRNKRKHNYPFNPANPIHDPSGYVYEAVPQNRVEGVQASIYYKETKEDMYGDQYEEIELWNAEEYAQRNPLFTDENGMYRWDVPQGLWQVKFEKDGYQTAYSEWLPVPPPQLEVNIGIVQNKQPEVTEARAYEQGVEVQFDKFMDLTTLTTDNIFVSANGEKLAGNVEIVDSQLADEFASADDADALRYASRVRFVPETPLSVTTGEIRLTVSRNVLSYSGIPMTRNYSQVLDVEKEIQDITADDIKVLYGSEKQLTVYAIPYDAAVGRTLHVSTSSDLVATVAASDVVFDNEGKALVTVRGGLPGCAQLSFSIDDVTATGDCSINVVTELVEAEAPVASRASGTAVYRGTKVQLTTGSKDAVIYFTTDGSCPCDEEGTRRKYTVPVVIDSDMTIRAMTVVGQGAGQEVSETVEFNYTIKKTNMDLRMADGWTWMSHNMESALPVASLAGDASVTRILTQNKESIRDPQFGMIGTLTEIPADQSFKVQTSAPVTVKNLTDYAWNPATPVSVTAGWNWLGYPVDQTMSLEEAFAPTELDNGDVIVGQKGFAQYDGEKWTGTLGTLEPGFGYMYQSASAKDVVFNTSIVSNAAATSVPGIADRLPLVLDIHKYASVMPVIATLKSNDGAILDNDDYQVIAFSGTECRGIGRVIDDRIMMSVYGNTGDAITFRIVDNDTEESYAYDTVLEIREDIVGSLGNPYEIILNGNSGIGRVLYNGNVRVYAEGDMLRIRGIDPQDIRMVEMFDMNGVKVLHETNVTESGIRLPEMVPGAYIVIVDGSGKYTYHKISVR